MNSSVKSEFMSAVVALQRGLTPAKALTSPQLSTLHRADPGGLGEALGNLLTFTALQFNVVRNLTDLQIQLLATDLPSRYWHWRIQEFVYVMREAVAGKWGKVYDRLDPPTVYDWCNAYAAEEQARAISDAAEKKAAEYKATALLAQRDAATMHKLHLRQKLHLYRPDQWLNLQRWLAAHYPGQDELLDAVSEEDYELTRKEQVATQREAEQRAKARRMLEYVADGKVPGEKEFAAGLVQLLPALPRGLKHLNETEYEGLKDRHTSAEEAA
jgi:hypothetical protein